MIRHYIGIAGKLVGVLMFIRLFMIPRMSSMTIGIILQAIVFISIGIYAVFLNKFSRRLHIFICICLLIRNRQISQYLATKVKQT